MVKSITENILIKQCVTNKVIKNNITTARENVIFNFKSMSIIWLLFLHSSKL